MKYLVFLVEERSMATVINGLMPRLFPGVIFQCLEHDGKKDLVSRLENRLRSWRTPGVQFVVLIDNDRGDCVALKRELEAKCQAAERPDTLIRIVCQELEAWYLGEPDALADALRRRTAALHRQTRAIPRSRTPCSIRPSRCANFCRARTKLYAAGSNVRAADQRAQRIRQFPSAADGLGQGIGIAMNAKTVAARFGRRYGYAILPEAIQRLIHASPHAR